VEQPTKKLCFCESSEDKVIITRITSGEQRRKKMCLGEYSEFEVTITPITSAPAHNESEDNGPMILQNTEDIIMHLAEELLERIMLKLNYDEISTVRRVCRRFRDIENSILTRQFHSLKNCVRRLADLLKEQNALPAETSLYLLILFHCQETLKGIRSQVNLLSAVGYHCRFLLPGDEQPNINY
jgi:hypothetical protein